MQGLQCGMYRANLHLKVGGYSLSPSPSSEVCNLDVILDSTLSFTSYIKSISEFAIYHLKNISRLWPVLSDFAAKTLIHAFITSRLDYCIFRNQLLEFLLVQSPSNTSPTPAPGKVSYFLKDLSPCLHALASQYLSDLFLRYTNLGTSYINLSYYCQYYRCMALFSGLF